jgi:5-methylcytosine-specific restriction endonuclease McrA
MTKRKRHSAKVKAAIVERQKGLCARSGLPLVPGHIQFDHILPLALGGADTPENMQALAVDPHKEKTRVDIGRIRKADRQRKKTSLGAIRKPKRAWASRKIPAHVGGIPSRPFRRPAAQQTAER